MMIKGNKFRITSACSYCAIQFIWRKVITPDQQPVTVAVIGHWRGSNGETLKIIILRRIVVSFSLVPPQEVQPSIRVCQAQGERAQPCCCISLARPGCIIVPCYWLCWSAGLLPACCSACQLFVYLAITPCKPWSFLNTRRVRGFICEESELLNFEC